MAELLTTMQAAKRAKTSRPTISRALKSGELVGVRGNDQRWLIDADDLAAWARTRSAVHDEQRSTTVQEQSLNAEDERLNALSAELDKVKAALAENREALARAEGENTANRERISDLTTERERLWAMLDSRRVISNDRRGFWAKIFGQS